MGKTLQQVWVAFMAEVFNYIEDCDMFTGEEVAAKTAAFYQSEWRYVEAAYIANGGEIGTCTDFTADFICRMLAGRV